MGLVGFRYVFFAFYGGTVCADVCDVCRLSMRRVRHLLMMLAKGMCGFSLGELDVMVGGILGVLTMVRGIPHSIQALDGGVEFLLVFDDGAFSEDNTFLASQVFAHHPVSLPDTRSTVKQLTPHRKKS